MSVAGILASSLFNNVAPMVGLKHTPSTAATASAAPKTSSSSAASSFTAQMNQLGADLQAGDLPAAKTDLARLQPLPGHFPQLHFLHPTNGSSSSAGASAVSGAEANTQAAGVAREQESYRAMQLGPITSAGSFSLDSVGSIFGINA